MEYTIIDAHSHLWLRQDTEVDGLPIRTLSGGKSLFMGEVRQMLPPFMTDGRNTAEVFLSNMDYPQTGIPVTGQRADRERIQSHQDSGQPLGFVYRQGSVER